MHDSFLRQQSCTPIQVLSIQAELDSAWATFAIIRLGVLISSSPRLSSVTVKTKFESRCKAGKIIKVDPKKVHEMDRKYSFLKANEHKQDISV